jgi:hypothetical protein
MCFRPIRHQICIIFVIFLVQILLCMLTTLFPCLAWKSFFSEVLNSNIRYLENPCNVLLQNPLSNNPVYY